MSDILDQCGVRSDMDRFSWLMLIEAVKSSHSTATLALSILLPDSTTNAAKATIIFTAQEPMAVYCQI